MDNTADRLAAYAAGLDYAHLTPAAVHAVKRSVKDAIGCALGAFHAEPLQAMRRLAARTSSTTPATVFGTRIRTAPEVPAFVNGGMIRYLDFSDDYFGSAGDSGPHPSDNIGGIAGATESSGCDGRALILGVAIAYEVCDRIVDQTHLREKGWDYSVLHAIATVAGAGRILGLSRRQLREALALAVVPNISLRQTKHGEISHWKSFAGPNGSRNELFAALLASEDITGPAQPFEGKGGLMRQLDTPFVLETLGGADTPFRIERTYFKYLPVRHTIQLPVWIALELRRQVRPSDIESICVFVVGRYAVTREESPAEWAPSTRETAGHSVPYLVAAALLDGEISNAAFTQARYTDRELLALAHKVELKEDPAYTAAFPGVFECRIEITLKSGKVVTVHRTNPKGHPDNPMSDHEIEVKFLRQAGDVIPNGRCEKLLERLWALENVKNMEELFSAMVV